MQSRNRINFIAGSYDPPDSSSLEIGILLDFFNVYLHTLRSVRIKGTLLPPRAIGGNGAKAIQCGNQES